MKEIVTIDIGAYLIKVLSAQVQGKTLEVHKLEHFPTPYQSEDTFDEGGFFDKLFAIVPQHKLKNSRLAIGLPSPSTNFSFFNLPAMARADLQRAIVSEAQRTIRPTPTETDILRYVIMKASSKEQHQTNVLAGAGIEADILRYFSLFENQGLSPTFIGSAASSLMVYPLDYYPNLPENWCFVDIGYTNTTIVIFSGKVPTLVRTILFATRDFVRAISTEKKIDLEAAQRAFLSQSEPQIVDASWEYLISEIRRSFAYYKEVSVGKGIEGVYFTGGIFSVGSYIDNLKKNIGGKVELFNLGQVSKVSLEKVDPEKRSRANNFFASGLGLALSLGEKKQTLNFLPASALKEKQVQQVQSLARKGLMFAVFGLVVIFFLLASRAFIAKSSLGTETKTFSEEDYQVAMDAEKEISSLGSEITAQSDFIATQTAITQSRRKIFEVIAKYIPTNAYLTTTEIGEGTASAGQSGGGGRGRRGAPQASSGEGETVQCSGWIQATYEEYVDQLKAFVKKLSKSGLFSAVSLTRSTLEEEPFLPYASDFTVSVKREFELELTIK